MKSVTIVLPCYNEIETLSVLHVQLQKMAAEESRYRFTFLFVDDASSDGTSDLLDELSVRHANVQILHLACNRGHQIALTAGMDYAEGDVIVTMDADLQDPPEIIPVMLRELERGFDVVHAQRRKRDGETWFKLITARIFYGLMRRFGDPALLQDVGDFRAFTRPVLQTIKRFREPHRFIRGIFARIGYRQSLVHYDRNARYSGCTKYLFSKMLRLAMDAALSFSSAPIRLIVWLALSLWGATLLYLGKALYDYFVFDRNVQGWTSIIILQGIYTGLILLCIAMVGIYVGRIFEQGQQRPLYWVRDSVRRPSSAEPHSREQQTND